LMDLSLDCAAQSLTAKSDLRMSIPKTSRQRPERVSIGNLPRTISKSPTTGR
jgi:hypothetical protein